MRKEPNAITIAITKIAVTIAFLAGIFFFVLGGSVIKGNAMNPYIKNGDIMVLFRLPKEIEQDDIVIYNHDGTELVSRVVATEGDIVEIRGETLYINDKVYADRKCLQSEQGIEFPYKVPVGQYFLLNENTNNFDDSRTFGAVSRENIKGTGLFFFRRIVRELKE